MVLHTKMRGFTRKLSMGTALHGPLAPVSRQTNRRRERMVQRSKSHGPAQLFLAMHSAVYNIFNGQRHQISRQALRIHRAEALNYWRAAAVTA